MRQGLSCQHPPFLGNTMPTNSAGLAVPVGTNMLKIRYPVSLRLTLRFKTSHPTATLRFLSKPIKVTPSFCNEAPNLSRRTSSNSYPTLPLCPSVCQDSTSLINRALRQEPLATTRCIKLLDRILPRVITPYINYRR